MAYAHLQDFIAALEQAGELRRIRASVSRDLEICQIADRVCKAHGPALLFENVEGSRMPVLINAFGSWKRMAMALGTESIEDVAKEIQSLIRTDPPQTLREKVRKVAQFAGFRKFIPKTVGSGICQEVVKGPDELSLNDIPIIKAWPLDGGPFISLAQIHSRSPATGVRNIGLYRMQVYDEKTTGMHWHIHHDGARHYQEAKKLGKKLELAAVLGGDPALTYSSSAPMPPDVDEIMFAGFLRKDNVRLVKCKSIDLEVPAGAEIVIEGYVDPEEPKRPEGPFGDHTGFYSPIQDFPVFHVTCITHRKNPVYPTIVVGKPPMEDLYMGKATERLFLPMIKMTLPEVVDINLPMFGIFHNFLFVSIKKSFPYHSKKVMYAIWGMGQMALTKIIVVVDEGVNVQDQDEVLFVMGNHIDPKRDITFVEGPLDQLDHACGWRTVGSKMGIDATRKWPEEGFTEKWPEEQVMSDDIIKLVQQRWDDYGLGDLQK